MFLSRIINQLKLLQPTSPKTKLKIHQNPEILHTRYPKIHKYLSKRILLPITRSPNSIIHPSYQKRKEPAKTFSSLPPQTPTTGRKPIKPVRYYACAEISRRCLLKKYPSHEKKDRGGSPLLSSQVEHGGRPDWATPSYALAPGTEADSSSQLLSSSPRRSSERQG